ncbi:MAG: DUF4886 domain-containing protein [Muribaculaceae bacterium]|nr:DUF4886 domain-containing protein [Muribaculaceae bacterium]
MNKKLFITLFVAILSLAVVSCSEDDDDFPDNDIIIDNSTNGVPGRSFKVLCFGNSFTEDAMGYVPMILNSLAPDVDVTIGVAYIGGCSLQQHLANFRGENVTDEGKVYKPQRYIYHKSVNGSRWSSYRTKDAYAILDDMDWDVVTFQQNGSQAHREWSQVIWPHLSELVKIVEDRKNGVTFGWILIHGAYGASDAGFEMYWRGAADNALKTAETIDCVVFPYGTAVQNLRLTQAKELGDGSAHNLTVDNGHLQEGIGCYCAALTNAITILHLAGVDDVDIMEDNTVIDAASIYSMNVPGQHFGSGVIGMTPENIYAAKQAALAAISDPYNLTFPTSASITVPTALTSTQ